VFSDLVRDARMLQSAKEIVDELRRKDPELNSPEHEGIRRFLERKVVSLKD